MSRFFFVAAVTAICGPLTLAQLSTSVPRAGQVRRPASSIEQPGDHGVNAHTTIVMYDLPGDHSKAVQPAELPPFPGYFFETPASIACVYHLVGETPFGCNPNTTTANPTGGGRAIAIVDAYDNPTAASDLEIFSKQFGLPAADFTVVFAQGSKPGQDPTGGWEVEESLDVQWAHAMAPGAKIFLVEAATNSYSNLLNAVIIASHLVASNGGGEVSMSWGGSEFTQETGYDSVFTTSGVVYLASAGDSPGTLWPSTSPNVISAGGTSISRDSNTGQFLLEDTWQDAGGGPSLVESRPAFQDHIQDIVGDARGTPDLSFDANPNTGVWVYDTNTVIGVGWYVVGGTSVSSPSLAGILNAAGSFNGSSQAENQQLYRNMDNRNVTRDIVYGTCGLNIGSFAVPGWDFCSGVGTPQTLHGK